MVRFAVLGCGRIGRMHARNIKAHPRATLVSVYDVMGRAAEETAAELGAKVAGSVDEVLADDAVEAVFIASSTDTHVDLLTRSAKAGKAILCEKPIDLDIRRVDACWNEIGALKPLVMLGFNRRFDPSFKSLRDRLEAGEINYPAVAKALHALGYRGTVGLESWASGDDELALDRFRAAFTLPVG